MSMGQTLKTDALTRARHFADIRITPANKLYLYRLLKEVLGTGVQHKAQEVEETLAADNILPVDLGAEHIDEAIERLGDLFKITTFKKGRYFVTLRPNSDFDQQLERVEATDAEAKATPQVGAKAWKQKRGSKDIRPAKPRPNKSARAALELSLAKETLEDAFAELEATFEPSDAAGFNLEQTRTSALLKLQEALSELKDSRLLELAQMESRELTEHLTAKAHELHELTVQELQEAADEVAEDVAEPETVESEVVEPEKIQPEADAQQESADQIEEVVVETTEEVEETVVLEPEPETVPEVEPEPEPEVEAEDEPATDSPVNDELDALVKEQAEATSTIQLTITYNPDEDETKDEPAQADAPRIPGVASWVLPKKLAHDLPTDVKEQVLVPNDLMAYLTQIAPFDADVLALLDADLKCAISSANLSGNRNRVRFPTRYERGNKVLFATLRRILEPEGDKHWRLSHVDGADHAKPARGVDGLKNRFGARIKDLLQNPRRANDWSSELFLTSYAKWNNMDQVLSDLAQLAAPEDWTDESGKLSPLQDYLAETLSALLFEDKVLTSPQGFSAINTGLMTAFDAPIFACFEARESWRQFVGFTTEDISHLALRMRVELHDMPSRASYFSEVSDLVISDTTQVSVQEEHLVSALHTLLPENNPLQSDALLAEVESAVAQAIASPAQVAHAYNPLDRELLFMLPLTLEGATFALILKAHEGSLSAFGVTTLQQARRFARTITKTMPQWLSV